MTMTDPLADIGAARSERDQRLAELMEAARDWPKDKRDELFEKIQLALSGELRSWYCYIDGKPGRHCDGEPHEGYDYPHARADQWPPMPMDWLVWFLSSGRGSGKTRTGAEYTRAMAKKLGPRGRIALVAPTIGDVRDTMIEGDSGLEFVCALAGEKIIYEPSKRRVTFPNGCIATTFSAEKPRRLRGPQHHFAWMDEPAHFENVEEVWSNLLFGLRLGDNPHVVLTSTPIPSPWVKEIQNDPTTVVTRVSTFKNIRNLAPVYRKIVEKFIGTRKGRQELEGELLMDVEGALWNGDMIVYATPEDLAEGFDRIVVGVDPAGSTKKRADETGIIVCGRRGDMLYVLDDLSGKWTPKQWATKVIRAYMKWEADAIVAEKNFGGDMVEHTLRQYLRLKKLEARIIVTHAARSKAIRAEPVVMLYEQGRARHKAGLPKTEIKPGVYRDLESEMTEWVPEESESPNRVDALVWAAADLFKLNGGPAQVAVPKGRISSTPALDRLTKGRPAPWKRPPRSSRRTR